LESTSAADGFVLSHCTVIDPPPFPPDPPDGPWLVLKSSNGGVLSDSFVDSGEIGTELSIAPPIAYTTPFTTPAASAHRDVGIDPTPAHPSGRVLVAG
jgi:hypothetical protein